MVDALASTIRDPPPWIHRLKWLKIDFHDLKIDFHDPKIEKNIFNPQKYRKIHDAK